jgi:hypothetical protein
LVPCRERICFCSCSIIVGLPNTFYFMATSARVKIAIFYSNCLLCYIVNVC